MAIDKNSRLNYSDHMPAGRPSPYSPELVDEICAEIASGHSIRTICKDESMPCMATIFKWLRTYPEFSERYAKAKQEQADALAEQILDIADDASNDWMATNDPENPGWKANNEAVNRSRLRVDARKWIAAKLKPQKYGEKVEIEEKNPRPSITINFTQQVLELLNVEQLEQLRNRAITNNNAG